MEGTFECAFLDDDEESLLDIQVAPFLLTTAVVGQI
jgi:hypothetical protein